MPLLLGLRIRTSKSDPDSDPDESCPDPQRCIRVQKLLTNSSERREETFTNDQKSEGLAKGWRKKTKKWWITGGRKTDTTISGLTQVFGSQLKINMKCYQNVKENVNIRWYEYLHEHLLLVKCYFLQGLFWVLQNQFMAFIPYRYLVAERKKSFSEKCLGLERISYEVDYAKTN